MFVDYLKDHPETVRQVASWIYHAFHAENPEASVEGLESRLKPHVNSRSLPMTLVAYSNEGSAVGTVSLIESDWDQKPELSPWLAALYVSPEGRKKGVATLLCKKLIEEARALHYEKIYLITVDQQNLYKKMGWTEAGEDRDASTGKKVSIFVFSLRSERCF